MSDLDEKNKLIIEAIKQGAIPEGWQEVEIEFFQFQNPGEFIIGKLLEKGTQKAGSNMASKYTLAREIGDRVSFLGSTQLDEIMKLISIGRNIMVLFDHEEPAKQGQNPMKVFRVIVQMPDKSKQ